MNERIEAIEAANQIMMDARVRAVNVNDLGHSLLVHAMRHLNNEMRAMIAE